MSVILATAIYFAIEPDCLCRRRGASGADAGTSRAARGVVLEMGGTMQGWLLGQLIDMIVVGLLVGIGPDVLHAPLALVLGVMAGLFTFIPYFGTIASAMPGLLMGLTVSVNETLWILGLFLVAHGVEGYLVSPFVQRRTVHLPPALTVLAMVVLTAVFGYLGVLIATPMVGSVMMTSGVTRGDLCARTCWADRNRASETRSRSAPRAGWGPVIPRRTMPPRREPHQARSAGLNFSTVGRPWLHVAARGVASIWRSSASISAWLQPPPGADRAMAGEAGDGRL